MNDYLSNDTLRLTIATASFVVLLIVVFYIYRFLFRIFKRRVYKTESKIDDFILNLFRIPALGLLYWLLLKIFSHLFLSKLLLFPYLKHINSLLLIFAIAWISIQFIKSIAYFLQRRLDVSASDNLSARRNLTQLKVFMGIANSIIVVVAIAAGLLTFDEAKTIGLSILTSAGIAGVIIGFAAQKSLGLILAGIQIAITQPIRLDDVVIVEGEWGRIEEITLTYVVVKIWDERRLMLPVTYFLEKPFQNWTRTSADILGSIFLYVGYDLPVDAIREFVPGILENNPNWDGRVFNVQVTNTNELYKEVRILLSGSDASKNWDLRTEVREKVLDFIQEKYPDCFARVRLNSNFQPQELRTDKA